MTSRQPAVIAAGGTERVSISPAVSAGDSVRRSGSNAHCHRLIRDDRGDVLAAVRELLPGADMLVTSGGISMSGEHDAIKAALRDLGMVSFGKVAMQPGMPQGQPLVEVLELQL